MSHSSFDLQVDPLVALSRRAQADMWSGDKLRADEDLQCDQHHTRKNFATQDWLMRRMQYATASGAASAQIGEGAYGPRGHLLGIAPAMS